MNTIRNRFSALIYSLEDFYSVSYFCEDENHHRLSEPDQYVMRALFNHKLRLVAQYDSVNELYCITSHPDSKLYRVIHPNQPGEYYPVTGEGASLSEALADFATQFQRLLQDCQDSHLLFFVIRDTASHRERMYQYDPDIFLAVRTDTLAIAA